jgi:hypothetical protein
MIAKTETIPETVTHGARYQALLKSIVEKGGFAIIELENLQNFCAQRDEERLEVSIKYMRDYIIDIGKTFREMQAVRPAPVVEEGGGSE